MFVKRDKTVAIIPAHNEEITIIAVLSVLLKSKELDEIIVVDDGSTDKTAEISKKSGAKVINITKRAGKGKAMAIGVEQADAEILVFFDADLVGLTEEHVSQLIKPVLEEKAVMSIGLRDRWWLLPGVIARLSPSFALGGERAMKRFVFEKIPQDLKKGFAIETSLNYFCSVNQFPVAYIKLNGLTQVVKEKKRGLIRGFWERLKMCFEITKVKLALRRQKLNLRV